MDARIRDVQMTGGLLERPFHFFVVLWGERFRNYFLDYCVASLLSPGNIPALATRRRSKFLIATRPEDWAAMRETAIFKKLESYVEPVYLEIPPCPPGRAGCEHMSIGHKLACEMSFREQAYAVLAYPDCVFSDGLVARMQELAREGKELVLCAALRFGEEPVLDNLRSRNLLPAESPRDSGVPLAIAARDLAWAAIHGLHPETQSYEWNAPYVGVAVFAAWWHVPGEDGMVLHALNWAPLLLDFGAVKKLDTSSLDYWTIDGDFVDRNFGQSDAIYVVDDSDEAFLASWSPIDEKVEGFRPTKFPTNWVVREVVRAARLRRLFFGPAIDPLKRRLFLRTLRWHARPLNAAWKPAECDALQTVSLYIGDASVPHSASWRARKFLVLSTGAVLSIAEPFIHVWVYRCAVRRRLAQVLHGDPDARRRVLWHAERTMREIVGLEFNRPIPRPPA
jgi:hypothetical protein